MSSQVKLEHDTGYLDLLKQIKEEWGDKGGSVVVGLPAGESGTSAPHQKSLAPLLKVAMWNEYGTENAPARPWLGPGSEIAWENVSRLAAEYGKTGGDFKAFLEAAGQEAANIVKDYVVDLDTPANAPSTIKKKGSDNPLIDTGQMVNSITHQVREE